MNTAGTENNKRGAPVKARLFCLFHTLSADSFVNALQLFFVFAHKQRSPYPADKLLEGARHHDLSWCKTAMRRCAETDLAMKSVAGADGKDLLVSLLLELSAGGAPC